MTASVYETAVAPCVWPLVASMVTIATTVPVRDVYAYVEKELSTRGSLL